MVGVVTPPLQREMFSIAIEDTCGGGIVGIRSFACVVEHLGIVLAYSEPIAHYGEHHRYAVRTYLILVERLFDVVPILVKQTCEFVHAARVLGLCHANGWHSDDGSSCQEMSESCFHCVNFLVS